MNKVKIGLTILSIVILVSPVAVELVMYRDNLFGLVMPRELSGMIENGFGDNSINGNSVNGDNNNFGGLINQDFQMPQQIGEPTFDPSSNTVSFTFNLGDPINQPVSVETFNAGLVSHDDGLFLGNITIGKPIQLVPGQTVDISTLGILSDDAINYFKSHSESQQPINLDLTNLNVVVGGISVTLDSQSLPPITIPQGIFG